MKNGRNVNNEKQKKHFAHAAHRLFSEYGQVILRSCQLYTATPKNIWLEMHRVYVFSETLNLLQYKVEDSQNKYKTETNLFNVLRVFLFNFFLNFEVIECSLRPSLVDPSVVFFVRCC